LLGLSDQGFFRSLYEKLLLENQSWPIFSLYAASMLLLCTFGLWTAIWLFTSFSRNARIEAPAFLFPFLVVLNYLVMFLGLALDTKVVGQPEELLHRPFVWAYFVVAAWSGAGVYVLLFGNGPPANKFARFVAAIIAISSFSVPLVWARNLQTLPFKGYDSYRELNSVPSGLMKACLYIRKHSQAEDLIQDSENDPKFWVTGLAERQDFAVECRLWKKTPYPRGHYRRVKELASLKNTRNELDLIEFFRRHKISWYLLQPESKVAWPTSFLEKPVFRAGDYRVYHFTP
jgi:hypothetical protein